MERRGGDLSERKKLILRAIIDAYISGGEPVGSKYLTQSGQIAFSSATIRNEMAELEEMGYLRQPHTSAGRVPSERGYRFYVDGLMDSYRMTANELSELNQLVRARAAELDKILDRASHLMSMMTNYASLTARPSLSAESVLQFSDASYRQRHHAPGNGCRDRRTSLRKNSVYQRSRNYRSGGGAD